MTLHNFLKGIITLVFACWAQTVTAAIGDGPTEILEAYLKAATTAVNEIYETKPDALERSTLINQSGHAGFWRNSRKTTMEAKGSGAAFAQLLGFRADSWVLDEFRQAGDFGEMRVDFSRTKTFRSGEQSTTTSALVYEMVMLADSWLITAFRRVEKKDTEVDAWEEQTADAVVERQGPEDIVKAQLDLLQGLPLQALKNASEKSAPLWQDTREARRAQGRVIAMVTVVSSYIEGPLEWKVTVLEADQNKAIIKALIISDKTLTFKSLVFTVEKSENKWLLADAAATM